MKLLEVALYRLDVTVQEAHGVDGFDGLEDLLPEPQGGAHGESSSGLTPPQVGQVTTLRRHSHTHGFTKMAAALPPTGHLEPDLWERGGVTSSHP